MNTLQLNMERHPLSAVFGDIETDDFLELKASIKDNGLIDPTIWVYENKVLDGWNRKSAVLELDEEFDSNLAAELEFKEFDGSEPVKWVMGRNMHRRHLSASQRAAIVLSAFEWNAIGRPTDEGVTAETLSVPQMAKLAGVSERLIQRSKKVLDDNPSKRDALIKGETTAGKEEAKRRNFDKAIMEIANEQLLSYWISDQAVSDDEPRSWWDAEKIADEVVEVRLLQELKELTDEELVDLTSRVFSEFIAMAEAWDAKPEDERNADREGQLAKQTETEETEETETAPEPIVSPFDQPDETDEDDEPSSPIQRNPEIDDEGEWDEDDDEETQEPPAEPEETETEAAPEPEKVYVTEKVYVDSFNVESVDDAAEWARKAVELLSDNDVFGELSEDQSIAEPYDAALSSLTDLLFAIQAANEG